jgi:hypothetical protein
LRHLTSMSGVIIIPLWQGGKFWTHAYRDGRHLNGLFASMQIVRMQTMAWEISRKDRFGGKELQFFVLSIGDVRDDFVLELVLGIGRCFRKLFGKECKMC